MLPLDRRSRSVRITPFTHYFDVWHCMSICCRCWVFTYARFDASENAAAAHADHGSDVLNFAYLCSQTRVRVWSAVTQSQRCVSMIGGHRIGVGRSVSRSSEFNSWVRASDYMQYCKLRTFPGVPVRRSRGMPPQATTPPHKSVSRGRTACERETQKRAHVTWTKLREALSRMLCIRESEARDRVLDRHRWHGTLIANLNLWIMNFFVPL